MSIRRKRRLKYLLRSRPRPAGPLPEPGELEGRPIPKEQRPQKQMFWRTMEERLVFRGSPRRYPILWGSYTFDNLFRLALGMFLGFAGVRVLLNWIGVANSMPRGFPATDLDRMIFQLAGALPPVGTLIALAFHWRRKFRIRETVGRWGALFGCVHTLTMNFAVIPLLLLET